MRSVMSETAERCRVRTATDRDIRSTARELLVEHGADAVTLRAIARALGITAPALYRYYRSREDLIDHLRLDICTDLAADLTRDLAATPAEDSVVLFYTLCRGFRRWALDHPREFTLVFATKRQPASGVDTTGIDETTEPFGRIFIQTAGSVLAGHDIAVPSDDIVPTELHGDIADFRAEMVSMLEATGVALDEDRLTLGLTYLMGQYWSRIYGHVTLEVFGNYPMAVSKPDALFDSVLADIASEIGLRLP
jgi:AcrR family transcriptional regulator